MELGGHEVEVLRRQDFDPDRHPTVAAYLPGEAAGAYSNGTRVIKVEFEEGDDTPLGTQGTVIASHAIPPGIEAMPEDAKFFYFIKWDDFPYPVGTLNWKIGVTP